MTRRELKTAIVRGLDDLRAQPCPDTDRYGGPCADCLTNAVMEHLPAGTVTG